MKSFSAHQYLGNADTSTVVDFQIDFKYQVIRGQSFFPGKFVDIFATHHRQLVPTY